MFDPKHSIAFEMAAVLKPLTVAVFLISSSAWANNPCIKDVYTADPTPLWVNNTLYIYCSHDANFVSGQSGYDIPNDILIHSTDLVNWEDDGILSASVSWTSDLWRPAVIYANGYYYLYFTAGGGSIGVLRSTSPAGPFTDPIGGPLVTGSTSGATDGGNLLDPAPFIDTNGQAYLYFGGGGPGNATGDCSRVIELNANMISVKGSASAVPAPNFFEQSGANLRNGIYYFSYSSDPAYGMNLEYIMANNPLFTSPTIPSQPIAVANPGAQNCYNNEGGRFVAIGSNWYAAYFNRALANANGLACSEGDYQRSVCLDQMSFNSDGTIQEVTQTTTGPTALQNVNPFSVQAAACMADEGGVAPSGLSEKGIQTEACSEGGRDVTDIAATDWIRVRNLDFTTCASLFSARIAATTAGGVLQLHLDSATGTQIGSCTIPATGGTQTWADITCTVSTVTGLHDLYFVFSGTTFSFESYWFTPCGSPTPTVTPVNTSTASPTRSPTQTPSPTRSQTPSFTATATLSASASNTQSVTRTETPSETGSATASATPSQAATDTPSVTASLTWSPEAILSNTFTPSNPASPSASPSPSVEPSGSPSATASPTSSPSVCATVSPSDTDSPVATQSPSPETSPSATASPAVPSATPLSTATPSPSASQSASPTLTFTVPSTPRPSPSATVTVTPTRTISPSASPTASVTLQNPSATRTASASPSATSSPALSTTAPLQGGPSVILAASALPNPNPFLLDVDMEGPASGLSLQVFTPALVLARSATLSTPLQKGWNRVPLGNSLSGLSQGLYYFRITVLDVNGPSLMLKVFLTR
jgi:arabinoxylan arabinofuranohydrolase